MIVGTLAILAFTVVYWKLLQPRFRPGALLLFGVFLYSAMASSIAVNIGLMVLVLLALRFGPGERKTRMAIGLAVLGLLLNKYVHVPAFQVVGLSYVSFRLISLCRAVSRQNREPPRTASVLLYVLFPPTFLSGPIEPYERFQKIAVPARLTQAELFASLFRLTIGLAKKVLFVEPLRVFANDSFTPAVSGLAIWEGLFAYSLFLYLDFSAYSDLAIGGARLFGYRIGENFNWPYLSASISEFWTRWHISLSQFLRDHVFMPLSGRAMKVRALAQRPLLVGSLASLFTMTLCGMWHGDRGGFAVWGFGHGTLLVVNQFYRQKLLGRLPARRRMKLQSHGAYRKVGTLLTFLCVSLLWVPFRFSLENSAVVYGRLFSVFFQSAM